VAAIYIDPVEFGAPAEVQSPLEFLFMNEITAYMVKRGQAVNQALRVPLQNRFSTLAPVGQPSTEEATA
jgi:hypothetical protein